uniref:Aminotransferase-like plant mobile domain-containing protein n=1 Tax=Fagus sylvatica TaxID=28930 RepID=A0A2N9IBE5_FAGSY
MASSSSMPPISPTPQPSTGERSGVPAAASTTSTEAVVGAPMAPSSAPGEATPVAPSSISGKTNDPKEGFVFPLVDPWFEISSLFPCKSLDFSFSLEDWDWIVTGSEVTVDRAWVPCLDEISNLLIQKGDVQPVPINFEDTELLREVLRRWYPSTHTFFFAWGELTVTLEDIANHWMLPILGEYSFSDIELSAAEEEVAAALRRHSSTKLSSWPTLFVHREDIPIRRATFILYWLYHEENVLLRPYGDDYPGFACVSVFSRFYQLTSLIHDLRVVDHRSLAYLSTVSPGWLPILSATGVSFIPYCPQRVKRQFGFDQDMPTGPQEVTTSSPNLLSFIKSRAFAYWEGQWDETRDGWIPYTTHLPGGWREFVNIVEERLIMPSKRGKGSKRDIPIDPTVEKDPKKPAPSPKKTSSTKTKAGKKTTIVSAAAPSRAKGVALGSSKSKSATALSSKASKKSVASHPPKGQRKAGTSSSSSGKEQPSVAPTPPPSKRKKFIAPLFPFGAATRTRSKSGFKGVYKLGRSDDTVVVVEDPDIIADDVPTSSSSGSDPLTATADQGEDLGKSLADSFEADIGPTEEIHSFSSDSPFDVVPSSVHEEQIVSTGSATNADDMLEIDELNIESHDLAIVTHAGHSFEHERGDSSGVPLSYVMGGISLFGATPRLSIIPAGGIVISASHMAGEVPSVGGLPFASEIPMSEVVRVQNLAADEPVADLVATPEAHGNIESAVSDGAQTEGTGSPTTVAPASGEHLDNIGMSDTIHMLEDDANVEITGEITVVSLPPRPIVGAGSSVGADTLSGEVADFLREFDRKTPNPHPEQHILAWKSVIQDLMEVGFNLGFVIGRLRQEEMVSAGGTVLGFEHGRSLFDSLFD